MDRGVWLLARLRFKIDIVTEEAALRLSDLAHTCVESYRHLYRGALHAVKYSAPARYIARDHLREAFRKGTVADYDQFKMDKTLEFLGNAAKSRDIEHRIVKNLIHVWWGKVNGRSRRKK
ncbi:MAG: hypothetical protein M1827_005422 [Pycnora praestabilis]|nr:MAG: hypothetical protein M1827_005422 [Pycnora praestabilis]